MTPEAQRIAIAEACGFKQRWIVGYYGGLIKENDLPDYLNDLNAMHEAEKILDDMQQRNYVSILTGRSFVQDSDITRSGCWDALHATASQRAEAFLRTLGLWKENEKE